MTSDYHLSERVQRHLAESARIKGALLGSDVNGTVIAVGAPRVPPAVAAIVAAARRIAESFRGGGKLLLCGNGGSAADCQHMAAEFTNILDRSFDRGPLPAIALTTDTSFLTAFVNDSRKFAEIFSRQIEALGRKGDILLGISTSGSSENVIRAVETAKRMGIVTVALTGATGQLREAADLAIAVPSQRTGHIQEAHLAIEHAICDLVEEILFRPQGGEPPEHLDAALV